jgi:NADH:ubiquinone reductase (non-electrogenic)
MASESKPTIVIVGTGWAGWTLAQDLSPSIHHSSPYNLVVISPSRTMALTPLLASAACSIFDFRLAEEPVRRRSKTFEKYQAIVTDIDFNGKTVHCRASIGGSGVSNEPGTDAHKDNETEFNVKYDKLILAPGCETNTFGTPGVKENALFMKTVPDARKLREGILDCLERASLPTVSDDEKKGLLHFVIVGGGPTGIELAAEVDELIQDHLSEVYPKLKGLCTISIYDVADRLLGQFGEKLSEYAMEKFEERGNVKVKTGSHIQEMKKNCLVSKEEGEVPFGVAVWAVGNTAGELVKGLKCRKSEGLQRI